MPIINTGRTNDGIPSPLKSGPWLVTMLFIIINASEMELARKNIQANEIKKKETMILRSFGAIGFLLVNL